MPSPASKPVFLQPAAMLTRLLVVLLGLLAVAAHAATEGDLLEPEKAFALTARALDERTVELTYRIANGYYMYRDKFAFKADGATLGPAELPPGKMKRDEFFGDVETYRGELRMRLPVTAASGDRLKLFATSQGCADIGVCYPPHTHELSVRLVATGASGFGAGSGASTVAPGAGLLDRFAGSGTRSEGASSPVSDEARYEGILKGGPLWAVLGVFLLGGIALTFTPCVLPMIPILSGIIVGAGRRPGRTRAFTLSLAYVLGMAITYTAIGVVAALSGSLLSAALQNAWVLGTFAAIFVLLALSMFGFYDLALPSAFHARVHDVTARIQGGRLGPVVVLGALSAVIVSPCVAAPLAGALLYIGQTRDVVLGGTALFALALGMGVPLVAVGTFEGALLPKAGAWMEIVKRFFGVLLLGVAIWIVSPVLPAVVVMLLWAALGIGVGVFLRAIDRLPPEAPGHLRLLKAVGVIVLVWGIALLIGAAAGSRDPLTPLAGLRGGAPGVDAAPRFERVASLAELDTRLAATSRPVMLDFYADWCVSCKEMERFTFADERVRTRLGELTLLKADVTANTDDDKALLKRFRLFGPPGIIFFDRNGREIEGLRVIGYQNADRFLKTLEAATTPL